MQNLKEPFGLTIAPLPSNDIIEALSNNRFIWNKHMKALQCHFTGIMNQFDNAYKDTNPSGSLAAYFSDRASFATRVANDLADIHVNRGDQEIGKLNSWYQHVSSTGAKFRLYLASTFDGSKPNAQQLYERTSESFG